MKFKVWDCKVVVRGDAELPDGFDANPRLAAISAIEDKGIEVLGCFSGWCGKLDEYEKVLAYGWADSDEPANPSKETL